MTTPIPTSNAIIANKLILARNVTSGVKNPPILLLVRSVDPCNIIWDRYIDRCQEVLGLAKRLKSPGPVEGLLILGQQECSLFVLRQ